MSEIVDPVCSTCRFCGVTPELGLLYCKHHKVVKRWGQFHYACEKARSFVGPCGPMARFYEPNWRTRLKAWFKRISRTFATEPVYA